MTGKIKYVEGIIIFIQASDKIIPVFAVYDHGEQYFPPIVAGYASTVHKVMGQTLQHQHITLAFDIRMLSRAIGYVALSRVSSIDGVITEKTISFYQFWKLKLLYIFDISLQ